MEVDYQLLTTVASGTAFISVAFASFLAKYKSDKKDDTEEVKEKIESAIQLDDVVQTMAVQLTKVSTEVYEVKRDNEKLRLDNKELKSNVEKLSQIVTVKYPMAIKIINTYRIEHPETLIEIPKIILDDLKEY